jgi:DNA helicase-2/ATP-dependent DNA helicase PcrA
MISQEKFEEIVVNGLERDISSNEDQQKAIFSQPNKSLFLVAGPGSGKTTVMVLKILKFIFVDEIKPEEIFATTFTRKAAAELYSRILGWGDEIKNYLADEIEDDFELIEKLSRIDLNQINVGTIDKLSEEIMRENKEPGKNQPILIEQFVANSAMIKILSENNRYKDTCLQEYLKPFIKKEKIDEPSKMSEKILEIKDRIYQDKVDIDELYRNCDNEGLKKVIECIKEYEKTLNERNTLDFTMLESKFSAQLKENRLDSFLSTIKIVLIDEYQDTNLIQEEIYFTIANAALKNGGSITVVGDDDQSLYRFRGATVDLFTNYKQRAKDKLGIDVEEINLKTNYRSTENIINHCNKFVELDKEYQNARVKNKPRIIAPDFDSDKMPVLGMFRNNPKMLSQDLSKLISKLVNNGEVQIKVLKVLDEEYYRKINGNVNIAHLQQINHQKEMEGKKIKKITLKLDSEYGSASDIAILSFSPKESQQGNGAF